MIPRYVAARREAKMNNSPETLKKWCDETRQAIMEVIRQRFVASDFMHLGDLDEQGLANNLDDAVQEAVFDIHLELENPED